MGNRKVLVFGIDQVTQCDTMKRKSCVLFSLAAYPVGGQSFLRPRVATQRAVFSTDWDHSESRLLVAFVLLSDFVQWIERKSRSPYAVTRSMEGLVYLLHSRLDGPRR